MRTRPDAHQETLTRRLALLRADATVPEWPDELDELDEEDQGARDGWWLAHTSVPDPVSVSSTADSPPSPVPPVPGPAVPVTAVPVPGRHASRRRTALVPPLAELLPATLRGRVRLGPAQLAVVALVLAAALAVTCWWLAGGRATTLESPVAPSAAASPLVPLAGPASTPAGAAGGVAASPVPGTATAAASSGAMVTVDVEGKVRRPGIVVVPAGSRVTDALTAAGGVPHHRALGGLNLAAVLVDGQQIVVGGPATAAGVVGGVGSAGAVAASPGTSGGALVNLNTATADQLDTLPGVGPVTAQSILEWREQNGGFTSVQELLEVDGIGPATLAKLTPHVTV
jgi:competence protein ComEA